MPLDTGIWTIEEATQHHDFSYRLAQYIGAYFKPYEQVTDIGCGPATYLRYLHDLSYTCLLGIEGTPQNFEYGNVTIADLTTPITGLPTGHTICLEVGEHIPEQHLKTFLDNIARTVARDKKLILSWATPGQDGIGHLSCRHNIWVIHQLEIRGFKLLAEDSLKARAIVEERLNYFRNTLMIFQKN